MLLGLGFRSIKQILNVITGDPDSVIFVNKKMLGQESLYGHDTFHFVDNDG